MRRSLPGLGSRTLVSVRLLGDVLNDFRPKAGQVDTDPHLLEVLGSDALSVFLLSDGLHFASPSFLGSIPV